MVEAEHDMPRLLSPQVSKAKSRKKEMGTCLFCCNVINYLATKQIIDEGSHLLAEGQHCKNKVNQCTFLLP